MACEGFAEKKPIPLLEQPEANPPSVREFPSMQLSCLLPLSMHRLSQMPGKASCSGSEGNLLQAPHSLIYKAFPNLKLGLHTGEEKGSYLTVPAIAVL